MNKVHEVHEAEEELKNLYVNNIINHKQMIAISHCARRLINLECGPEFAFYEDAHKGIKILCNINSVSQKYYIEYIFQKLFKLIKEDNKA